MKLKKEKLTNNDYNKEVKEVYDIYDIMNILGIGKTSAYRLVKSNVFNYVTIGKMFRIPKVTFDQWLYQMDEN